MTTTPRSAHSTRPIGAVIAAAALAVVAATAVLVLAPAALPAAEADIPTQIVRGDVGISYEYDYESTPGYTPSIAYPYRVEAANGSRVIAYCVEWPIGTGDGVEYSEGAWNGIPNLPNVNWVLQNGSPVVSNADLTDAVEAHSGQTLADYSDYEARGVTQWAAWHYTDGFEIARVSPSNLFEQVGGGGIHAALDLTRLTYLYDYLTDPALNVGLGQPTMSLAFDASAAVWNGEDYGPIRIVTNAASAQVSVTAGNATLVDASGTPVSTATAGTEFFVHTPVGTTGTATLAAEAPLATLATGTLLFSPGQQTLMVADELDTLATAALDVTLTPQLPNTGTEISPLLWIGGAVLVLGGAVLAAVGAPSAPRRPRHR